MRQAHHQLTSTARPSRRSAPPQHLHGGTVNSIRTDDEPVANRFDDSRRSVGSSGFRWWHRPGLVRVGGASGMLSPLPLLAAGLITATAGQDLRQKGFPWAATLAAILTALSVLGLTARHTTRWAALVRRQDYSPQPRAPWGLPATSPSASRTCLPRCPARHGSSATTR